MNYIKIITNFNILCLFLYIILTTCVLIFRSLNISEFFITENIFLHLMLEIGKCFFICLKSAIIDFLYYSIVKNL